jgi:hypothetical protein
VTRTGTAQTARLYADAVEAYGVDPFNLVN